MRESHFHLELKHHQRGLACFEHGDVEAGCFQHPFQLLGDIDHGGAAEDDGLGAFFCDRQTALRKQALHKRLVIAQREHGNVGAVVG